MQDEYQPDQRPPIDTERPIGSDGAPVAEDSFVTLFTRLVDDAEDFVRAEVQLYRAEAFARLREGRTAIILLAVAFFLAQSAVVALLVGLLATLRRPLGPAGATAVVVAGALAIAGALVRGGIGLLKKATKVKDRRDGR